MGEQASLRDRRIVVTGAGSGLGRSAAIEMARRGAVLALVDVSADGLQHTVDLIGSPSVRSWTCDLSIPDERADVFDDLHDWLGTPDVLVHVAGIMRGQLLDARKVTQELWDSVIDVNLTGAFFTIQQVASWMMEAGEGVVILVGSVAGVWRASGSLAYGASKGGLHGLAMSLEQALEPFGIRVNEVCPNLVGTPLLAASMEEGERNLNAGTFDESRRQIADPIEVARVLAFLASADAGGIRGVIRTV